LILLKKPANEIMTELSVELSTLKTDLEKINEVLQADAGRDAVTESTV
jgi:hypothetical protein